MKDRAYDELVNGSPSFETISQFPIQLHYRSYTLTMRCGGETWSGASPGGGGGPGRAAGAS